MPAVKADGQRLTYDWDATVQEWWVNDARGLEHGFTVKERPPQAPGSSRGDEAQISSGKVSQSLLTSAATNQDLPLTFTLAVRGSLTAQVAADGLGVEFRDATGATVLHYAGLKVWDADGRMLASHFEPLDLRHPSRVTLSVDERGAR